MNEKKTNLERATEMVDEKINYQIGHLEEARDQVMKNTSEEEMAVITERFAEKIQKLRDSREGQIQKLVSELDQKDQQVTTTVEVKMPDVNNTNKVETTETVKQSKSSKTSSILWWALAIAAIALAIFLIVSATKGSDEKNPSEPDKSALLAKSDGTTTTPSTTDVTDATSDTSSVAAAPSDTDAGPNPTKAEEEPKKVVTNDCCDRVTKLETDLKNLYNQVNDPKSGLVTTVAKHEYQINDEEKGLEPRVAALEEAKRKAEEARAKAIENAKKRRGLSPAERLAKLEETTEGLKKDKADKTWVQEQLNLRNGKAPEPTPPQTVYVTPTDKGGHGIRKVGD